MRRGANRQQVQQREFAVSVPFEFQKSFPEFPTVREQVTIAIQHPLEVNAVIDLLGQLWDLGVVGKKLRCRQYASQKIGGVNGRYLAIPFAIAIGNIHPMIEPSMFLERSGGKKPQRDSNALGCLFPRNPSMFSADADGGHSEAGSRETGDIATRSLNSTSVRASAVVHHSS